MSALRRGYCDDNSLSTYRFAGLETAVLRATSADATTRLAGLDVGAHPTTGPISQEERPDYLPALFAVFAEVSRWRHSGQRYAPDDCRASGICW